MSPVPANNREPNKQEEEASDDAPQLVIEGSDSDSEGDEGDGYNGYQLLPQDPDSANQGLQAEDGLPPVSNTVHTSTMDAAIMQALDTQDMMNAVAQQSEESHDTPSETVELWNTGSTNPAAQEPMDPEHAEKIKSAMAGFVLPPSAQPAWASQLSDDDWKQALFSKSSSPSTNRQALSSKSDDKSKDKPLER